MTKKQMVTRIVETIVWQSLYDSYGISTGEPTEKQVRFIDQISGKIYDLIGKKFSHEELQEMLGEEDEDVSDSL